MGETKKKILNLKRGKILNVKKAPTSVLTIRKVKVITNTKGSYKTEPQQVRMVFAQTPLFKQWPIC